MEDDSGSTTWDYDSRGRMTQESKENNGSGKFKTIWSYHSADMVTTITYPGDNNDNDPYAGEVVSYYYLPQMLMDTINGTDHFVNNTDYDVAGREDVHDLGLSGSNPVIKVDYTCFNWTDLYGQGRLKQIKTFRLKYIFLAGKIIRTARSVIMKLSEKYPYREMYEQSFA